MPQGLLLQQVPPRPLQPHVLQEPPPVIALARKHVPHRTWTAAPSQQVASHPSDSRHHTWVTPPYCPAGSAASKSCPAPRNTLLSQGTALPGTSLPCTLIVISGFSTLYLLILLIQKPVYSPIVKLLIRFKKGLAWIMRGICFGKWGPKCSQIMSMNALHIWPFDFIEVHKIHFWNGSL